MIRAMTTYGAGSLSSPIVISDDEDEAFVELELEQRLSSPRESMEVQFDDDFHNGYFYQNNAAHLISYQDHQDMEGYPHPGAPNGHYMSETNGSTAPGQKRKRNGSPASPKQRLHLSTVQPLPARPRSASPEAPPGESKRARKKRRRQELMEARNATQQSIAMARQNFAMAGPSNEVDNYIPAEIPGLSSLTHLSSTSSSFSSLSFALPPSLPPKPMMYQDFPIAIPPLPPPNMHLPIPPLPMYPLPPPPTPTFAHSYTPSFANLPPMPNFQPEAPPPPPVPVLPTTPPAPDPPRKALALKKSIGMTPDPDPESHHGTYTSPSPTFSPPNPARTLVMELLPKKFRMQAFVRGWASKFAHIPPRVDLNVKVGKALIEFPSAEVARSAWDSDRLSGDGKEHIRLWWYRVPAIGVDGGVGELEEGEIEDGEVGGAPAKRSQVKNETKAKESKKKKGKNAVEPLPSKPITVVKTAAPTFTTLPTAGSSTASSSTISSPVNGVSVVRQAPPHLPQFGLPPKPVTSARQMGRSAVPPAVPSVPVPLEVPQKPSPHQIPLTNDSMQSQASAIHVSPTVVLSTSPGSTLQATAPPFIPKSQRPSIVIAESIPAAASSVPRPSQDIMDTALDSPAQDVFTETGTISDVLSEASRRAISAMLLAHSTMPVEDDAHSISSSRPGSPAPVTSAEAPVLPPLPIQSPTPKAVQSLTVVQNGKTITALPVGDQHPAVTPMSATPTLRSAVSTPTPPPSEPRATRGAPKVPSYAKRKEVEELMAKRREERASRGASSSSGSATPVSEVEAMIMDSSAPSTSKESSPSTPAPMAVDLASVTKEDDLRRLVLSSRRSRNAPAMHSPLLTNPNTPNIEAPSPFATAVTVNEIKTQQPKLSLDDMAASFIAQSIQAVTFPSTPTTDSPLVSPIFSEKALLSAKQKILEQNIADQKELMVQYTSARSKADRERLMKAMAERSRAMEQEMNALTARVQAGKEAARTFRFKWPETDKNAYILVVSDDEDE